MVTPCELIVKNTLVSEPTEGGGVEPQWLMSHSPTWQVGSSTHWQRPLDICPCDIDSMFSSLNLRGLSANIHQSSSNLGKLADRGGAPTFIVLKPTIS